MKVIQSILFLLKLCLKTPSGKVGLLILAAIIALELIGIQISLKFINWNKEFYNALEEYDVNAALRQIAIFLLLTALGALQYLIANYARGLLLIRWRKELTNTALNLWLSHKNYWYLEQNGSIDNPDQRIAEDCRMFIQYFISSAIEFITRIVALFTYFALLWSISEFALHFTLFKIDFTITHYLIWLAPIYVLISTLITHYLGSPLMRLNIERKRKEADFRFALTNVREKKEAIALQNGEETEKLLLNGRFQNVVKNWHTLIRRELILGCFTRPYFTTVLRIPLLFALPIYLINKVSLGSLMQIASAFQSVVTTLSWFIFSYSQLADMAAAAIRLSDFLQALKNPQDLASKNHPISSNNSLSFHQIKLQTRHQKPLLEIPEKTIIKGESFTVIQGISGLGKSTLFKTLAGLHPHFKGEIRLPTGKLLFLPQQPYFPLAGLLGAISYPLPAETKNQERVIALLEKVGFSREKIEPLIDQCDFSQFSGGEQQRLIIARVLFNQPDWVFMDESCNALDKATEQIMLSLLKQELPNTKFILISHNEPMIDHEIWRISAI